ncbi:MAG: anthranilate synthase component II [Fidelibacterota bacterium]
MKKILLIDNYDSFTYNLYQQTQKLFNGIVEVCRNDAISIDDIQMREYSGVILSPGPKSPRDAGISKKIVESFYDKLPLLGICLGMQCINEVFGGTTKRSPLPVHGKSAKIIHQQTGLFKQVAKEFYAARYHSLIVADIPPCLIIDSKTEEGIVMSVSHRDYPVFGLQFHPESFLTQQGDLLIREFLNYV